MGIPSYVNKLFLDMGDVRPDAQKHDRIVIERILRVGDIDAIKWMFRYYSQRLICETATTSHELTRRDISFWSNILDIPRIQFKWISKF